MELIASTDNPFGGTVVKPEGLNPDPEAFSSQLRHSLGVWRARGLKVVWLEIPIAKAQLIPLAAEAGFVFHHSGEDYLMLVCRLQEGAFVPRHASHYIGAGGVVFNDKQQLLVVSEKYHQSSTNPPRFKLPGGALHEGEHLVEGVVREVLEETGVQTQFDALVCFRHWHGYRYGKSDIYFVCRLHPLSAEISMQEEEIEHCLWMPVEEYLAHTNVHSFNKSIVRAALHSPGIVPTPIEGYTDPSRYEFFMPRNGHSG